MSEVLVQPVQSEGLRPRDVVCAAAIGLLLLNTTAEGPEGTPPKEPASVQSEGLQFAASERPIYGLPVVDAEDWEPGTYESPHVMASADLDEEGVYDYWFDDAVPGTIRRSFQNALLHPIAQLTMQKGNIAYFNIEATSSDNGYFSPDDVLSDYAALEISPSQGLYFDSRMMEWVVVHESVHGLSNDWYQYMWNGERPDDVLLAEKIDRVKTACANIRNDLFAGFIKDHLSTLIYEYQRTYEQFNNPQNLIDSEGYPATDQQKFQYLVYQQYLLRTIDALERRDPGILTGLDQQRVCQDVDPFNLVGMAPGNDPDILEELDTLVRGSRGAVMGMNFLMEHSVGAAYDRYKCNNDGLSAEDLLETERYIGAGHPWDDPTEMASSLMVLLATNPDYLQSCLDGLVGDEQTAMLEYISAIIDITAYTHPDLIVILNENPTTERIIMTALSPSAPVMEQEAVIDQAPTVPVEEVSPPAPQRHAGRLQRVRNFCRRGRKESTQNRPASTQSK